jgi:hypothetical protein
MQQVVDHYGEDEIDDYASTDDDIRAATTTRAW